MGGTNFNADSVKMIPCTEKVHILAQFCENLNSVAARTII